MWGRHGTDNVLDFISTENDSSMVCHAECRSGWFMIRVPFCEYLLHPNDLHLNWSPDSVMFVNVNPVASSVAQAVPTDTAGMIQAPEIQMFPGIV